MTKISNECRQIAKLLLTQRRMLVLAESCTAGLVAASLGRVPGISNCLCGSLVTYCNETKAAWLKIPSATLVEPGPVSETVARLMVEEALEMTPEADVAASVTGHLGPNAPAGFDGLLFVGLATRRGETTNISIIKLRLNTQTRIARQREATALVLTSLRQVLLSEW